jgi:hypothetical protein
MHVRASTITAVATLLILFAVALLVTIQWLQPGGAPEGRHRAGGLDLAGRLR